MGLHLQHRKLIQYSFNETVPVPDICSFCNKSDNSTFCRAPCFNFCPVYCQYFLESLIPSQSPPIYAYDIHASKSRKFLIITVSVLSTTLFVLLCYVIFAKIYLGWWSASRRRSSQPQIANQTRDDHFLDEDHGPLVEVDHHIWYINTVGLQPSIISGIPVCKYKRGDGLVEGTDCAVCLCEFQEDETLRLLPNCSHAFHISCIDTWLRSHTNCPMCRAPIVKNAATATSSESSNENSGTDGNTQVSILVDDEETETELEGGVVERRNIVNVTEEEGELQLEHTRKRNENSEEMQPIRRSVSLDFVSASKMIQGLANFVPEETIGNSDTQLAEDRDFSTKNVAKRVGRTESLRKFVGSSSIGRSLQNAPVQLKRSISCSGKFLFSRST